MWAQRYCRGFKRHSQLAYFHHPSCTHWKNYTGSKNTPVTSNPHNYMGRVSCCNIARYFLLFPLKKDKSKDATMLFISKVVFTGTWKWPKSVLLPMGLSHHPVSCASTRCSSATQFFWRDNRCLLAIAFAEPGFSMTGSQAGCPSSPRPSAQRRKEEHRAKQGSLVNGLQRQEPYALPPTPVQFV